MADLRVDYEALGEAERALDRIVRALQAAEARRDHLEGSWGSRKVADAMRLFVDNWDRHRSGLIADITSVGTMCGETRMTFLEVERALRTAAPPEGGSP